MQRRLGLDYDAGELFLTAHFAVVPVEALHNDPVALGDHLGDDALLSLVLAH